MSDGRKQPIGEHAGAKPPPPPAPPRTGVEFVMLRRGVRKLTMSYDFLAQIILVRQIMPGRRIYSNMPADLKVFGVEPSSIPGCFTIYASSLEWPVDESEPAVTVIFHEEAVP